MRGCRHINVLEMRPIWSIFPKKLPNWFSHYYYCRRRSEWNTAFLGLFGCYKWDKFPRRSCPGKKTCTQWCSWFLWASLPLQKPLWFRKSSTFIIVITTVVIISNQLYVPSEVELPGLRWPHPHLNVFFEKETQLTYIIAFFLNFWCTFIEILRTRLEKNMIKGTPVLVRNVHVCYQFLFPPTYGQKFIQLEFPIDNKNISESFFPCLKKLWIILAKISHNKEIYIGNF